MRTPTISVVIPCRDVAPYIGPCLQSVLAQQPAVLQLIVVDDGSCDSTVSTVEAMQAMAGGNILLLTGPRQGAAAARNRGLAQATGTYVQFLDADDVLLPGKLSVQAALASAQGLPDLIVGDYWKVLPDGQSEIVRAHTGRPWLGLIATQLGTTSANLWKRSAVQEAGGWTEQLASSQDYELLFRLLARGATVAHDTEPRTQVLKRASGSISRTDEKANWLRYIDLRLRIQAHLQATHPAQYAVELTALKEYLFMAIHLLAQQDLPLATELYRRHLPPDFVPQPSAAITRRYILAQRMLGFQRAVRLGRCL